MQKMSDALLKDCPECSQPSLVKLVSAAGFHLKGNGWYKSDSGSPAKGKKEDKPAEPAGTCGAGACSSCALD